METRIMHAAGGDVLVGPVTIPPAVGEGWVWVDVVVDEHDADELVALTTSLDFDALAASDAVGDFDLPKVDDFGHHLLTILHGLCDDRIQTYEVDCFLNSNHLLTVRHVRSSSIDALWARVQESTQLASGGVDVLLARLADVLTRRLAGVVDAFDNRTEELIGTALAADPNLLEELMAVRGDLAAVRRVVHPQREALDVLRLTHSELISDDGRRRFSDVFDLASRAARDLDAGRSALAEILDAYRGAEAREATEVTRVLTVYAAIMLPLSLVAGFFGMNFANLPWLESELGWMIVTAAMVLVAAVSLGVFVAMGWIRRPSGRGAGVTLGRGLIEASRAPAQIVAGAYQLSIKPIRRSVRRSAGLRSGQDE